MRSGWANNEGHIGLVKDEISAFLWRGACDFGMAVAMERAVTLIVDQEEGIIAAWSTYRYRVSETMPLS